MTDKKRYENDEHLDEKRIIGDDHENAPDEGKEDVPTEDKVIHDSETGEETVVENDNKNWKLK